MKAPHQFAHLSIGGVDAGCANEASHRHAWEPRRERETERDAGSALINAKPPRNWDAGPRADPAGNQCLLRHDPCRFVSINLEDERLFGPREIDTVDVLGAAMKSREPDRVERTIEIADNCPDLLKFEIDGHAFHRRTPLSAVSCQTIPATRRPPGR